MRHALLASLALLAATSLSALGRADKVVLGRLGQTRSAAQIYAAPDAKARVVARLSAGRRVVVRPGKGSWAAVVMDNGRLAYVPSQSVELMAYEVTVDGTAVARPRPGARLVASRGASVPRVGGGARETMAATAMSLEGSTPYKWGGTQLGAGIDCSGFVREVAGRIGMRLPRTAAEQAGVGQAVTRYEDLRAGDRLYFWDARRGKIGHTGIYIGGGYFTHSNSGKHGITRDYLSERWRKICVAARR